MHCFTFATLAALHGSPIHQVKPQVAAQVSRRAVLASLPFVATLPASADEAAAEPLSEYLSLPLSERMSALHASLTPLAPLDYALQKQREKQEKCYEDGYCAEPIPYYAIECERDDDYCLQRKRRLAAQEFANFRINPTSSPVILVMLSMPVLQWSIAATRIAFGIIKRNQPPPPPPRPPPRQAREAAPVQQPMAVPVQVPATDEETAPFRS